MKMATNLNAILMSIVEYSLSQGETIIYYYLLLQLIKVFTFECYMNEKSLQRKLYFLSVPGSLWRVSRPQWFIIVPVKQKHSDINIKHKKYFSSMQPGTMLYFIYFIYI